MSSSGKTQHFDCCIRRFESCHPSQKQQMHFASAVFCFRLFGRIRTDSPSFAKQKGHKIVASDKACLVGFCHPSHVVASYISLAAIFYRLALIPLLLLSETGHAQVACSVVNALTTALFRYHPVSGCY